MNTLDPRSPMDPRRGFDTTEPGFDRVSGDDVNAQASYGTGMPGTAGSWDSSTFDAWNFRPDAGWETAYDMVGYHIEATDGSIGKIDEAGHATDQSYLVVDTGPWIFGKKVVLPAGTVTRIDHEDRKVYVDRTKDQIKACPEYDPETFHQPEYRDKVSGYYGDTYQTHAHGRSGAEDDLGGMGGVR